MQRITALTPMSGEKLNQVKMMEVELLKFKQEGLRIEHFLHDGVYCRTVYLPKDVAISGAEIKIKTTLVVSGHVFILGEDKIEINGYSVLTASEKRKQIFYAKEKSFITMFFKTDKKTVEEAERYFTDNSNDLIKAVEICRER